MDFELTEEQLMFRNMAHKFAEREMLPNLREYEVAGKYQHELIGKAAKLGLVAPHISQEYGGLGLDYLTTAIIFEELCWASYSTAHNFLGGPIQPGSIIDKAGTQEQKQKWLPPMCRGELFLAGAAVDLAGQVLDADNRGDNQRHDEQSARPVELVLALIVTLVVHDNALYNTSHSHNLY